MSTTDVVKLLIELGFKQSEEKSKKNRFHVWSDKCRHCGGGNFIDYNYEYNVQDKLTRYRLKVYPTGIVRVVYFSSGFTVIKDIKADKKFLKKYFKP